MVIAGAATAAVVLVGLGVGAGVVLADNSSDISRLQDRVAVLSSQHEALTTRVQAMQNAQIQQESAFGFSREHLSRAGTTPAVAAADPQPASAPVPADQRNLPR